MYQDYMKAFNETLQNTKIYKEQELYLSFQNGIEDLVAYFREVRINKTKVYFIGNGGSAGIASHMTVDFMKNAGINTSNFYDSSVLTCLGNDLGYENIFSYPLKLIAEKGDVLIAISSSGNSDNIVNAVKVAKEKEMSSITFSGFQESNKIKEIGDYNVYVPICHYGIVESIHTMLLQYIVDELHMQLKQ